MSPSFLTALLSSGQSTPQHNYHHPAAIPVRLSAAIAGPGMFLRV
jgi:hypothetical protein